MEFLSFSTLGQWSLHKALNPPKDADAPDNKPFKSYNSRTASGQLPVDRGTKGSLHNFGGGQRPKPKTKQDPANWGKPAHPVDSVYEDVNPGSGE